MAKILVDIISELSNYSLKRSIESTGRFRVEGTFIDNAQKQICKVIDTNDNQRKVLKILRDNDESKKRGEFEWYIWREISLKGDTTHILRMLEAPISFGKAWGTLTELANFSLDDLITELRNRKEKLSEQDAIDYITQISTSVKQAHYIKVSHNDLKPSNILVFIDPVSKEILLKVGDFASSTQDAHITTTKKGTLGYMPPEGQLTKDGKCQYGPRGDIYSLGIILYQLLHPKFDIPFEASRTAYKTQIDPKQTYLKRRLKELDCSKRLKDIILICLQPAEPKGNYRYPCVDDFLAELTQRPILKQPSDLKLYTRFNGVYNALKAILSQENLHQGTKYGSVAVEQICDIQAKLDELKSLDDRIRATDLSGYSGNVLTDIETKVKEIRDVRYEHASQDRQTLFKYCDELQPNLASKKPEELKQIIYDLYQIVFAWGPPLATEQIKRERGKERYTWEEIQKGAYKEAISPTTQKKLNQK